MTVNTDINEKIKDCKCAILAFNGRPINKLLIDLYNKGYYPSILAKATGLTVAEVLREIAVMRPEGVSKKDFYGEDFTDDESDKLDFILVSRDVTDTSNGYILDLIFENQATFENYMIKVESKRFNAFPVLINLRVDENLKESVSVSNVITNGDLNILALLRLSGEMLLMVTGILTNDYMGSSKRYYTYLLSKYSDAVDDGYDTQDEELESLQIIRELLIDDECINCTAGYGICYDDMDLEDIWER